MKMITAIVNKEDANAVCNALTKGGFSVTKLSTTGGFLMAGNMTLLIGTDDEKVDKCIELIASCSKQRKEVVPSTASYGIGVTTAYPLEVTVGGATVFVTRIRVVAFALAIEAAPTIVLPAPHGSTTTPEPPSQKLSAAISW